MNLLQKYKEFYNKVITSIERDSSGELEELEKLENSTNLVQQMLLTFIILIYLAVDCRDIDSRA